MSGFMQRISTVFRAKADKALDRVEDPRETLDYSYQRQLELLQKVRRGVADVATSRKRVELQATQLNQQLDKLTNQAQKALEVGREDLAREALTRKSGLQQQLGDLQVQHAQLQGEEEKLVKASQRLQAKVDAFRTRKETIKATYSAAEAQTRINEAFSGIGEEMGDVGLAIQRAEDKTAQLQARAGAMDELLASGALDDPTSSGQDDISRELEALSSGSEVEDELSRMKAQIGAGPGGQRHELTGGHAQQGQPEAGQHQLGQQPGFGQGAPQQAPGQYQGQQQGQAYEGQQGQAYEGQQQQGHGQQGFDQPQGGHAMPPAGGQQAPAQPGQGEPFRAYPVQPEPGQEGQR